MLDASSMKCSSCKKKCSKKRHLSNGRRNAGKHLKTPDQTETTARPIAVNLNAISKGWTKERKNMGKD
jgi:hypothetical protein